MPKTLLGHFPNTVIKLKSPVPTTHIIEQASIALTKERISHIRHEHQRNNLHHPAQTTRKTQPRRLHQDTDLQRRQIRENLQTYQREANQFDRLTPPTRTTHQPAPASQKTVINLSNHQLTDTENRVLGLGLNFAVAPKKIPSTEVILQVEPSLRLLTKEAADNIRLPNPTPPRKNEQPSSNSIPTHSSTFSKSTKETPLSSWTRPTTTRFKNFSTQGHMLNSRKILHQASRDDSTRNCSPYTRKTSSPSLYTSN